MEGYFYVSNERFYNIYKANLQEALDQGGCVTFCVIKIAEPSRNREGFLFYYHSKPQKNESCCCRRHRVGRHKNA
jgi:hypothetical protein